MSAISSTNQACGCLTSVIRHELVYSIHIVDVFSEFSEYIFTEYVSIYLWDARSEFFLHIFA